MALQADHFVAQAGEHGPRRHDDFGLGGRHLVVAGAALVHTRRGGRVDHVSGGAVDAEEVGEAGAPVALRA
jgi:hypothetical protein